MSLKLHIGHAIRIAREQRGWNQEQLGQAAARFKIEPDDGPINVNTVSSVEREPYNSKHGTIWRLMAALDLSFSDIPDAVGAPIGAKNRGAPLGSHPAAKRKRTG